MPKWTQQEISQLEKHLLQNKSLEEISTLLDRTLNSITKKTMRLGYEKVWQKVEKPTISKIDKYNEALSKCFIKDKNV